jgi:Rrf2 family protein
MFQISRRADYAVRIMIELGLHDGSFLSATKVSRRTAVPKAFLHKITHDLAKNQLITTQSGPSGGLTINKSTTEINMRQILEAVEGPICLNVCLVRPQECKRDAICPAHDFWGRLQVMLIEQLEAATLAALIAEAKQITDNLERRQQIPYLIRQDDVLLPDTDSQGKAS